MKIITTFFSIIMLVFISLTTVQAGKENPELFYDLQVTIEPATNQIAVQAKISFPPDSCFYLNRNWEILHVFADGEPVTFGQPDSSKVIQYSVGTTVLVAKKARKEYLIEYTGTQKDFVAGVNVISPDLVELALYSAWFPMFGTNQLFGFRLEANLPASFVATSNGRLEAQKEINNRRLTNFVSVTPGFDIVLAASPHFKKVTAELEGTQIEIYFNKLPVELIQSKKDSLLHALNYYSDFYGHLQEKGLLRLVYAPRSGWGYSRVPLFLVSEEYALSLQQEEFGLERDFHGTVHELAHFWWWMLGAMDTPNDWINEGLAEFSAFRISERCSGKKFTELLIKEYQEHAAQSDQNLSIAETKGDSNDRYVNRYEKITLLFLEARRRFGESALDQVFKTLRARFAGTSQATAESFLDEIEKQLGPKARAYFKEGLYGKKWIEPNLLP